MEALNRANLLSRDNNNIIKLRLENDGILMNANSPEVGNIEEKMMYNTFNMGLGMVLAVDPADVDKTMEAIREAGDTPYVVGRIEDGEKGVTLC